MDVVQSTGLEPKRERILREIFIHLEIRLLFDQGCTYCFVVLICCCKIDI
jgi:hypothetical protein